jgi:O-6-methylguanine DNA methyltransferase
VKRRIQIVSMDIASMAEVHWGHGSTPVGPATIAWSRQGIHFLTCGDLEAVDQARWCAAPANHRGARELLARIFDALDHGPFRVGLSGTDFQRAVWTALCDIPAGCPVTYGMLAARIKRPRAVRAVGGACGANPVAVLIPCHRVIAGDGSLGGYSGGWDVKRRLLAWEGWSPE